MASTIKVDNIQDQCGSAVVTKCGASKTLTVTTTKANNYQAADGGNIINQCGSTITLGASGDTITLACGASQTGFGRTGTVNWDTTAKTASFTAVSGNGYFVNTTSGAITVTLPASPSAGDIVSLADYTNTWQTNAVTVGRNSQPIGGIAQDAVLGTEGQSVTFVYVDGTEGWKNVQDSTSNVIGNQFIIATGGTITTCGNCKIHTFTGPGTFCVSQVHPCAANNEISYMVVAGGGGGGARHGGGGGAGGFREDKSPVTPYTASPLDGAGPITVTATGYPITVGGGGPGMNYPACSPFPVGCGSNSIFSTITSTGGGGGHTYNQTPATTGGSGGGGGHPQNGWLAGAAGNTPPVSPPQGNSGGSGGPAPYNGGGGGGATAGGGGANACDGGPGGAGAATTISGSSTFYAGGGGGGRYDNSGGCLGSGGAGGGGTAGGGPPGSPVTATAGTANTGGGGGGYGGTNPTGFCQGANGGSGIVIIRYKYQ